MGVVLLDAAAMRRTMGRMAHEILESLGGAEDLVVVGVLRRGYPMGKRLAFLMTQVEGTTVPCGKLDAHAWRDDKPAGRPDESEIPFGVTGKHVVLVDEVVFTGRTVRAALDALLQYGRPKSVKLAVLIDRGHRELPIQPDFVGRVVPTDREDRVVVRFHDVDGEDAAILEPASAQEPIAP